MWIMSFWNNFSNESMKGQGSSSPPFNSLARSPSSPFCTSPSQLQEITLDQDGLFTNAIGLQGTGRNRTVKEFEEQLSNLKKENFNLKLRIYFLEEKMGTNFTLDKDNVVRKNIELQVEIANLQQEVKEKHELLCQAVKAMEIEEDEHKKYSQKKESELEINRQEIEELKEQIQIVSRINSEKSSKHENEYNNELLENRINPEYLLSYSSKFQNVDTNVGVASISKNSSNISSFAFDRSDTLKHKFDHLHKECQLKDNTINSLTKELTSTNSRLIDFAKQIKEYEEKLSSAHHKNENLISQLQQEQKATEQLFDQLASVNEKYSITKYELEQEIRYKERDQKTLDCLKKMSKQRIAALEDENLKQIEIIKDLQCQLELAVNEARKNQNIAVSKCGKDKQCNSNIDDDFILATNPTTSDGTKKKDSSHVQLITDNQISSKSISGSLSPASDIRTLMKFERILNEHVVDHHSNDILIFEFNVIKNEFNNQQQKIAKLKREQLKACEIIKGLINFRNKSNEEIEELKEAKKQLEKEMENMVSKPQNENISAAETPMKTTAPVLHETKEKNLEPIGLATCENTPVSSTPNSHDTEMAEQYKKLSTELETKNEVLLAILHEKDSQLQQIKSQYDELEKLLCEKENRIVDLEFDLLTIQDHGNKSDNKSISDKSVCAILNPNSNENCSNSLMEELGEKQEEIKKLKFDLKKSNSYLQEIVNKELWERNREIEKLHKKNDSSIELQKLKEELLGKDQQLKMLKEKISEFGLDITFQPLDSDCLIKNSITEVGESKLIEILKYQNEQTKSELEECEKLKNESNKICLILNTRLRELAIFLDDLLNQNMVLGLLGTNKKLRQIIDSSLQMSQSFTDSFATNTEQTLAELTNITQFFNDSIFQDAEMQEAGDVAATNTECRLSTHLSIIPDDISLTYESHLYKKDSNNSPGNKQVILALRRKVCNLENQLKLRDNEISKINENKCEENSPVLEITEEEKEQQRSFNAGLPPDSRNTSSTLKFQNEAQSESEAWSEPDRSVSRARIGLNSSILAGTKRSITTRNNNESTEDDSVGNVMSPSKRRSISINELDREIRRLSNALDEKCKEFTECETILKQELKELDDELQRTKKELKDSINDKETIENKMENLQKIIDYLTESKHQYELSVEQKNKETLNKINNLQSENKALLENCQLYEQQAIDARNKLLLMENKLKHVQENVLLQEEILKREHERNVVERVQQAENDFNKQMKIAEEKYNSNIKLMEEKATALSEQYSKDFIKKSDVEDELKIQTEEILNLKTTIQSNEKTINLYKDKEIELKKLIEEYQKQIDCVKSKFEQSEMLRSELLSEKTKLVEEINRIKQEILNLNEKNYEQQKQSEEVEENHNSILQAYEKQIITLKKEKSGLELKISEVENANADLHNRLIKSKARFNFSLPTGTAVGVSPIVGMSHNYQQQQKNSSSGHSFSVVDPEENTAATRAAAVFNETDNERAAANSSPDLGIESDHGRLSSLENNNAYNLPAGPLIHNIELTKSLNDLFDAQNINSDSNDTNVAQHHCCQKSVEITNENNELKRKLIRMKRALEETTTQLNLINQRKKQVEKTICKQIHKTSQVLRQVKANLDSGSDTDALRM